MTVFCGPRVGTVCSVFRWTRAWSRTSRAPGILQAGVPLALGIGILYSFHDRKNSPNLVRRGSYKALVAGLALCGRLQDELGHVRFDPWRCQLPRDMGHCLLQGHAHSLDELWTVSRHHGSPVRRRQGRRFCSQRLGTETRAPSRANVTCEFSDPQNRCTAVLGYPAGD
jgi:hypothetical protein